MPRTPRGICVCLALVLAFGAVAAVQTVVRDVVIVGGGAAGAHAAVWLRDHNKSVAVIEKRNKLVLTPRYSSCNLQAWISHM